MRVTSEVGPLRRVICHTPGNELLAVTPATRDDFLYDDIIDLELARKEHGRFKAILSMFSEVMEVRDLLTELVDQPGVREFLIEALPVLQETTEALRTALQGKPTEAVEAMMGVLDRELVGMRQMQLEMRAKQRRRRRKGVP